MLPYLRDAHIDLELMRSCFSFVRVAHLMGASPPEAIGFPAMELDEIVRLTFYEIMSTEVDKEIWRELQPPIFCRSLSHASLGLGVIGAARTAPAAFLASTLDSEQRRLDFLESAKLTEEEKSWNGRAREACGRWAEQAGVAANNLEEVASKVKLKMKDAADPLGQVTLKHKQHCPCMSTSKR